MANFTNTASISYNGVTTNSNTVTGEILESAIVSKTLLSTSYTGDSTLTYAVSISNPGDTALDNVTVTDDLGGYDFDGNTVYPLEYVAGSARLFVNGALVPVNNVTSGPPVVFGSLDIPAGGNAILVYEARVTAYAPLEPGSVITNTADVSGANCALPATASATASVVSRPELTVSKFICPDTVCGGGEISYTIVIRNSGNRTTTQADNLVVSDVFDPQLSEIAVTLDGESLPATSYAYDEVTGEFRTIAGEITVPAATFERNADGQLVVTPGTAVLKITGII